MSKTNEQALESAIEKCLTGTNLEELKAKGVSLSTIADNPEQYRSGHCYYIGLPEDFNQNLPLMNAACLIFCNQLKKMNWQNSRNRVTGN
jgi:hypothetical protein